MRVIVRVCVHACVRCVCIRMRPHVRACAHVRARVGMGMCAHVRVYVAL